MTFVKSFSSLLNGSYLTLCLLAFGLLPGQLNAEAKKASQPAQVSLVHTPPKPDALPYPGQTVTLIARLLNTRDTTTKLVAAVVKDGKYIQIASKDAYLNEYDQPTYEISVPAPVGEMVYQLILFPRNGENPAISPRYVARRTCLPNVELGDAKISPELRGYQKLEKLVSESRNLENDLAGYEKVMALIQELQQRVNTK